MANCCTNGLNQVFCNAFNKYYNTLYTNGEISKEETNNLLIIDYIRQCLSDDRYDSYYNILLKALRCIANNSCLLDTSWLYNRSIVPKVTNEFVTILTKQAFVETDPTVPQYVKDIKLSDITNWDNKLSQEIDPIFNASPAASITNQDIDNWNSTLFIVNLLNSENTITADVTFDDISSAYENNNLIIAIESGNIYQLSNIDTAQDTKEAWFFKSGIGPVLGFFKVNGSNEWIKGEIYLLNNLISGTSIKTINNETILGPGNIEISTSGDFNTFCPIIEDTRSSNSGTITGNAPFSTLVDGQMIILHLKQNSSNNTLTLTLSDNTTTSAIPVKITYQAGVYSFTDAGVYAGDYYQLRYEQANSRWITIGRDRNNVYGSNTQAQITAGTDTTSRLMSPKLIHDNAYIVEETYSSGSLKANKMYDFGTVSSVLSFTLDTTNDLVSNALNFYALRFIAGADNLSITFPTGVEVDDTPTINTGDYVEIMINKYGTNYYASIKVWQAQSQNS